MVDTFAEFAGDGPVVAGRPNGREEGIRTLPAAQGVGDQPTDFSNVVSKTGTTTLPIT